MTRPTLLRRTWREGGKMLLCEKVKEREGVKERNSEELYCSLMRFIID